MRVPHTVLVVPCYNEARRLNAQDFARLASVPGVVLIMVDDGSTDATAGLLGELSSAHGTIRCVSLDRNVGKAEAVRRGLLEGLELDPAWVGYIDADLATPIEEVERLHALAEASESSGDSSEVAVILAARVGLLGSRIDRSFRRHYLGRVFAAAASVILGLRVYDTQCGAKLFRVSPALDAALAAPFHSRWAFDVELIGRLLRGRAGVPPLNIEQFIEVPLNAWRDVGGSKLTVGASVRSGVELLSIRRHLRRWR